MFSCSSKPLAALVWLVVLSGLAATPALGQVPIPEDFLPSGRVGEYVQSSSAFLKKTPGDRFAPRVAFDLYVLFSSMGKKAEAEQLRGKILLDYPHSFQAGYLITTFEDAGKFASFLDALAEKMFAKDPKGVSKGFCRLFKVGLQRFRGHPELSENLSLLLKGYLFSQVAGEKELGSQFRKNLALKEISLEGDQEREIVQIALSRTATVEDRILQLHVMEGDKLARFLKKIYLSALDEATAALPSIRRVKILAALEEKEHAEALGLIESLPDADRNLPEIMYWKGLCHFGLGQDAEAVAVLTQVYKGDPQGKWAGTVKAFGEGILTFNRAVEQQADLCHRLVQGLLKDTEVFQVRVTYEGKDGQPPMHVYVGVMPGKNFMEVSFTKGEELIFAYRTTNIDSTLFFKDEPVIHQFPQPGPILSPSLDVERKPEGGFSFNAEASMETNFSAAKKKSQVLLDSPLLSTKAGIQELLAYSFRKQGACPLQANQAGEDFVYQGLLPTLHKPGVKLYSFKQNALGKVIGIGLPSLQLTNLQYGSAAQVQLTPPEWPEKQVQNHAQLDIALFLRVFSVLAELVK